MWSIRETKASSIIDISKPTLLTLLKAVGVIPWPDRTMSSRMSVTGAPAFISESEVLPMHSDSHGWRPRTLGFVSNPAAPRVVQRVLGSGQVASGRAKFYLCLEWRRIVWVVSEPADRARNKLGRRSPMAIEEGDRARSRIDAAAEAATEIIPCSNLRKRISEGAR